MNGRSSRCLFAAFTQIAPGVEEERFQRWYEEVHRPDSIAAGMFQHSSRYQAASPSRVRFLTLWEAGYPDQEAALSKVRPGALRLRAEGRVWPVQTVVFQLFVFAPAPGRAVDQPVATLTTLHNDWEHPARRQSLPEWQAEAVGEAAPLRRYHSSTAYACTCHGDAATGRFLWLGESSLPAELLQQEWGQSGRVIHELPPLGLPIPIFPPEGGGPMPGPSAGDASEDPAARRRAWAVHWRPVPSRYRSE